MSVHYGHLLRILHWCTDQSMTNALENMELTAAQGHIMGFLAHRKEPPCPRDIEEEFQLSHPTVSGLLSRLEKKGVIVHEKESRVFVYTPCVKRDDYLAAESRTLADRFFDGAMKQMVVSFLDQRDLTPEDLDELQSILDKKRRQ